LPQADPGIPDERAALSVECDPVHLRILGQSGAAMGRPGSDGQFEGLPLPCVCPISILPNHTTEVNIKRTISTDNLIL
jgi:hypothetical protein